jgi:uncharacterized protein (DUF433 family)
MNARIEITPAIRHGKPVIRGSRVPVARILGELAAGTPTHQIQADYGVSSDDVRAALTWAEKTTAPTAQPLP